MSNGSSVAMAAMVSTLAAMVIPDTKPGLPSSSFQLSNSTEATKHQDQPDLPRRRPQRSNAFGKGTAQRDAKHEERAPKNKLEGLEFMR